MPAPLRSVREQENPVGDRVAYLPEGRPGARDVGCRRDRDETGIRLHRPGDRFGGDVSVRERTDVVAYAAAFEKFERAEHGIMLHAGGDDVVAGGEQPEEGDVERFGAVFRKDRPFEAVPAEKIGEGFAAFEDEAAQARESLCPLRPGLAHSFAAEVTAETTASGFLPARGGVVEIEHVVTLFRLKS